MVTFRNPLLFALLGLLHGCAGPDVRERTAIPPVTATVPAVSVPFISVSAPDPISGCPCVVASCVGELGVKEEGRNSGDRVRTYLRSCELGPGYPWCAAFVHWNHRGCGAGPRPDRAFALAAKWGSANTVWKKGDKVPERDRISQDGDVFTLWYNSPEKTGIGHCGVIEGEDDKFYLTIEGNTGSGGEREGDGVYRRKRSKKSIYTVNRWCQKKQP